MFFITVALFVCTFNASNKAEKIFLFTLTLLSMSTEATFTISKSRELKLFLGISENYKNNYTFQKPGCLFPASTCSYFLVRYLKRGKYKRKFWNAPIGKVPSGPFAIVLNDRGKPNLPLEVAPRSHFLQSTHDRIGMSPN